MKQKKLILVVEDEPALLWALSDKLGAEGFEVIQGTSGKQALDLAIEKKPDLILLDIMMPHVSGLEFLKQLKEDDWGKTVPVFMLTSFDDADIQQEAKDYGAEEYLIKKDWSLDQIIEKIKNRIGGDV